MTARAKLAVIMHADVVGSTALVHLDERVAHERMRAAFQRLAAINALYDGTTHEVRGDALVAEFERASDAVSAALAFQARNADHNYALADDIRPGIRIGIALGEVVIADDTLTGAGVVLAQRLEQLAEPGGVCISAATREALPARLPFQYGPLGEQKVKGFDEPVRAFLVALDHEATIPEPEARAVPRTVRSRVPWAAAAAGTAVVIVGLGVWIALPTLTSVGFDAPLSIGVEAPPTLGTSRLSIAVLPFTNISGESDQDYFADALTEDLTADLSRIAGSFVISRSTAATYRGHAVDAKRVADELGVRYVLEGSVRKAGDAVRVGVQLIDGETGQQLWSERFEKSAGEMYTFQDEVTGRVARALNLELKEAMSRQAARGPVSDLGAADLALRGWAELWTRPQSPETNDAALTYVARALEIDPKNAEAYAVAAYAYARAATYGWGMPREEAIRKGIASGERAVALDPKNADAFYALAFVHVQAGDTLKSQEMLRECIAINRNHAPAYGFYGLNLIRLGHPRDTIPWVERAFALSPRDPLRSVWYAALARAHVATGDDALAVEAAAKGIAANRKHAHNHAALASALAHLGRMDEAEAAVKDFQRVQPGISVSRYSRIVASDDPVARKTNERLMAGLRKAGLPEA